MEATSTRKCSGSNTKGDLRAFPGDDDICTVCHRWVQVKQDGTLRAHTGTPKPTYSHEAPKVEVCKICGRDGHSVFFCDYAEAVR